MSYREPWEEAESWYSQQMKEAKAWEKEHWYDEDCCDLCDTYHYMRELRLFQDKKICIECIEAIKKDAYEEAFEYVED